MTFKSFQPQTKALTMSAHDDEETIPPADEIVVAEASQDEDAEEAAVAGSSASDKRAKFKELAGKRVSSILEGYRILGKLANPSAYPYTPEDVEKIFGRLESDLADLKEEFQPKKVKDTTFVL